MQRLGLSVGVVGLVALALFSLSVQAAPMRYVAGDSYTKIAHPVTPPNDGKIHVIEFFLYSCPHCYHFEDTVVGWAAKLPGDVAFRKVPVLFGKAGKRYARVFYTEKELGVFDQLHEEIFDAIHQDGKPLLKESAIRKFFVAHGVDGKAFDTTFNSKAVDKKIRKAGDLMRAFRVTGVPSLGIAGQYKLTGRMDGSNKGMLDVADYLIEQTRQKQ